MAPFGLLVLAILIVIPVGLMSFKICVQTIPLTSICLAILIMLFLMLLLMRLHPDSEYMSVEPLLLIMPAIAAIIAAVILVIQFLRWIAGDHSTGGVVTSEERQKTLKMVDEGKISSQEASELLDALGRSSAMRGRIHFRDWI